MSRGYIAAGAALLALAASLLLARMHPFGDAGLYTPRPAGERIGAHTDMPPEVLHVLTQKCADCHSSVVEAPLYGRLAPFSWWMERDVLKAREELDLSRWDTYPPEKRESLKSEILIEARSGRMPLPQYRFIHRASLITFADLDALTRWAHSDATASPALQASSATQGDAVRGQAVFEHRCTGCHTLDQDREGPRLRGVYGRDAAAVPGFTYSAALKNAHLHWDDATLDRWLSDPDVLVPANDMEIRVPNPQERKDLIRFLRESAAK